MFVVSNTRSIASRREDFNLNRFMCSVQRIVVFIVACFAFVLSAMDFISFFFTTAKCSLKFL